MSSRRFGRFGSGLLFVVPLAFLAVFFVWPVGAILARGLFAHGSLDLGAIGDAVRDPAIRHVAWFTVWQATLSTLATLAIALAATAVLSRYQFVGRGLVIAGLTMPFVLPTVVVATAFRGLGVDGSLTAILLAHAFFNVAVVVRVVGAAWVGLDPRTVDAARTLGAGPGRTFTAVTLPALRPAIAAAASIVFLFCFTSFGVILILGGPRFATLETEIYRATAQLLDLRTAAALSVIQLVAVAIVLVVAGRAAGRSRRVSRTARTGPRMTGARTRAGAVLASALAAVLVGWPLLALVRRSFAHGAAGYSNLARTPLGASSSGFHALGTSVEIAIVAATLATGLGLALATAITRPRVRRDGNRRPRLAVRMTESLAVLPLGVSAVTVGFGFLIVFDTPPLALRTSWWIIPIAHALVALPFVVRATVPTLRAVDPHQREVAALLGATPARVWREVDARIAARAAVVAAGFAFASSLGEFGATLFIVRPETTTAPVAIFRFLSRPGATNVDQAMALATLLAALTGIVALVGERLTARRTTV
ncbi:MAG: iron ABC transporter permease [Acidimicrobiia bacterium]